MKKIAVHDGKFHADDIFAVAVLKLIYPDLEIVRTRDEGKINKVDLKIDVGGRYDPESGFFDHHQFNGSKRRENGIPFASAGLVWEHFGRKLVDEEAWKIIDEKIIQFIDADDEGVDIDFSGVVRPYTIADFIASLNPIKDKSDEKYNEAFDYAVSVVLELLKSEIVKAEASVSAKKKIMEKIVTGDEYVVLDEDVSTDGVDLSDVPLKYLVAYNSLKDSWGVSVVLKKIGSFEAKKDLPAEWAGLSGEELNKVTGIDDGIYCFKRVFAIVKSKESALKLVRMALDD